MEIIGAKPSSVQNSSRLVDHVYYDLFSFIFVKCGTFKKNTFFLNVSYFKVLKIYEEIVSSI